MTVGALLAAVLVGVGVHLVWGHLVPAPSGRRDAPKPAPRTVAATWRRHAPAAALGGGVSGAIAFASFGLTLPTSIALALGAAAPVRAASRLRSQDADVMRAAWPRLLDELRVAIGQGGRPLPDALWAAGTSLPPSGRAAFLRAQRRWQTHADLPAALAALADDLADPDANEVLDTLLVAHEVGGNGLERRLAALAAARRQIIEDEREATAEQSGARFARRFVLLVPAGMALLGTLIGPGTLSYQRPANQALAAGALVIVAACWWWSGHLLRLPAARPPRVAP